MAFNIERPNGALGGYALQALAKTNTAFVSETVDAVAADLAATNEKINQLVQGHGGAYMNKTHEAILNANAMCLLPDHHVGEAYCDQLLWRCRDLGLRLFPDQNAIAEDAGAYCVMQVISGTASDEGKFLERGEYKDAGRQFKQLTADIKSGKKPHLLFMEDTDALTLAKKEHSFHVEKLAEVEKKIAAVEQKLAEKSFPEPLDLAINTLTALVVNKPENESIRKRLIRIFQWHKDGGNAPSIEELAALNKNEQFSLYLAMKDAPGGAQVWKTMEAFNRYYDLAPKHMYDNEHYLEFLKNRTSHKKMIEKSLSKIDYVEKMFALPSEGDWKVGKEQLAQAAYLDTFKKVYYQETVDEMQEMVNQLNAIAKAGFRAKFDPKTFRVVADPDLPPNSMTEAELEKAKRAHLLYMCQLTARRIYPVNFNEQKNVEAYFVFYATGMTKLDFIEHGDAFKARNNFCDILQNVEKGGIKVHADPGKDLAPVEKKMKPNAALDVKPDALPEVKTGVNQKVKPIVKPVLKQTGLQRCIAGLKRFFKAIGRAFRWFFTKISGKRNTSNV